MAVIVNLHANLYAQAHEGKPHVKQYMFHQFYIFTTCSFVNVNRYRKEGGSDVIAQAVHVSVNIFFWSTFTENMLMTLSYFSLWISPCLKLFFTFHVKNIRKLPYDVQKLKTFYREEEMKNTTGRKVSGFKQLPWQIERTWAEWNMTCNIDRLA